MTESREHKVSIYMFVDAGLVEDKSIKRSQTGELIFINKAPINLYIKKQANVEASTFGAEFCTTNTGVEMVEDLHNKLHMFEVPIYVSANVFCENEAVYKNTITPQSFLKKMHHSISYQRCREAVAARTIRVTKQGTVNNLSDLSTKVMTSSIRRFIIENFTYSD